MKSFPNTFEPDLLKTLIVFSILTQTFYCFVFFLLGFKCIHYAENGEPQLSHGGWSAGKKTSMGSAIPASRYRGTKESREETRKGRHATMNQQGQGNMSGAHAFGYSYQPFSLLPAFTH